MTYVFILANSLLKYKFHWFSNRNVCERSVKINYCHENFISWIITTFFFIPPRMFLFIWRKMKEKKNLHSQDIHRHTTKNIQPQDIFEIMCGVKIKLFVYTSIIYSYTIKIPPTRRGCQRKKWVFRSKLSAYCLRPHEKFKKLWIVTQMLGFFF